MWLIPANTKIEIFAPFGRVGESSSQSFSKASQTLYIDHGPWKLYITKADKIYDKEDVWDLVAVMNGRDDMPHWAEHNIRQFNKVVVRSTNSQGKVCYAMVKAALIKYLD